MNTKAEQPKRIEPFYVMSEPEEEILLIEKVDATARQVRNEISGSLEAKGKLSISQEWSPMAYFGN